MRTQANERALREVATQLRAFANQGPIPIQGTDPVEYVEDFTPAEQQSLGEIADQIDQIAIPITVTHPKDPK